MSKCIIFLNFMRNVCMYNLLSTWGESKGGMLSDYPWLVELVMDCGDQ